MRKTIITLAIFIAILITSSITIYSACSFNNNQSTSNKNISTTIGIGRDTTISDSTENNSTEQIKETSNSAVEETTASEETTTIVEYPKEKYICKDNDNFYRISIKFYGTGEYSQTLQEYNKVKMIHPGTELIIPSIEDPDFIAVHITLQDKFAKEAAEFAFKMENTTMKAGNIRYSYGHRADPKVDIVIPDLDGSMRNNTLEVDTSNYKFYGTMKVTGYTPTCVHCCHNTQGITSSGVMAINGYTVACSEFEFGTTLYIPGWGYYVVEDRGPEGGIIDIACPTHEQCGPVTSSGKVEIYIVE